MQTSLEEEILKTERLRTTILFIVFTLLSLMWLLFILFYPEVFLKNDKLFALLLPAYLSGAALYFLLMRIVISKYIVHKKIYPCSCVILMHLLK